MGEQQNRSVFKPGIFFWVVSIFLIGFVAYTFVIEPMMRRHAIIMTPARACINNLRQIDAAANRFALEHEKTNGEAIHFPDDLTPYIKLNREGKIPGCPQGGSYHISAVGEIPTCSLSNTVKMPHILP